MVDGPRLRQILTNLLGNALKFTHQGEVLLVIEPGAEPDQWRFRIRDSGIGIPPEKQKKIFEAFSQADSSTTRRYGGTGLGLTISARLVSLMGGELSVQSEPGVGSEFAFTLVLQSQQAAPTSGDTMTGFNGERVLVVDDNSTNLRLLDTMLRQMNLTPTCVNNAKEALRLAGTEAGWPLILLDAQMPDMDGVSLALEITVLPQGEQSHIIMLSSMSRHFDANMLKRIGIAHYLHKPVAHRELYHVIASVLAPAPATAPPPPAAEPATEVGGLNILLAEDNLVNQKVARRLLERLGHRCEVVNNGREALTRWREQPWDLLFIDLQMPEMDGETALRLIREETRAQGRSHQPAIVMTAHAMQGDKERCLAMGFDGYIAKPVNQEALQQEIARVGVGIDKGLPDEARLLRQCADDPDLVQELLMLFSTGLDESIAAIVQAIDNDDREVLRRAAHRLRGEALTLGFTGLTETLQQLESEAASLDLAGLSALRRVLLDEAGRSATWLRQRVQEVKHDP